MSDWTIEKIKKQLFAGLQMFFNIGSIKILHYLQENTCDGVYF